MTYKHPLRHYAETYKKHLGTIKRYARSCAPMDDPAAMKFFLAAKKDTGRTGKGPGAKVKTALPDVPPNPDALAGAEHTLRRLAEEERQAHARLDAAKASKDPDALKLATELFLKIAESLLRYERGVSQDRRDSGEVLTRSQMTPILTSLAAWLRRANLDFLNSICLQIAEAQRPEEVYAAIAPTIRQSVTNAVNAATNDGRLPGWVKEALLAGL
jgi:hypothetical protein